VPGPERTRLVIASRRGTLSVALLVAGPALLGRATDILFDGIVGAQLRPGDTKEQPLRDCAHTAMTSRQHARPDATCIPVPASIESNRSGTRARGSRVPAQRLSSWYRPGL